MPLRGLIYYFGVIEKYYLLYMHKITERCDLNNYQGCYNNHRKSNYSDSTKGDDVDEKN
jgi:hypothetical protein